MKTGTPKPSWTPSLVEDHGAIEKLAAVYSSGQRAFVVYGTGTVVFSDTAQARADGDYDATLEEVVNHPPDFKVMPMEDGNYLVRFAGPVTGIVVADFFQQHKEAIVSGLNEGGLLPGEQLVVPEGSQMSDEHYRVGLYARAKLYVDASCSAISRRFIPG